MIVFHGSTSVIKAPDTNHSKRFLDFRGLWDRDKTLAELRFSEPNDQYCFVTQDALSALLSFKESEMLEV